ncbi:hypothetical protein F7725_019806 [Dissostichus mawsoni]|uniref:Uncharacterized protein n=1 Tax=Dissostichus mawsoni TaxID=36200 RepID=A0A7J5YNR1_DISMA|nr:hypothetical protein F7725_019806 [Dissostichus mawsoni]
MSKVKTEGAESVSIATTTQLESTVRHVLRDFTDPPRCAVGYMGYPSCQRCNCSVEGSTNADPCVTPCVCKENVEEETVTAVNWDSSTCKVTIQEAATNAPVWASPASARPPHGDHSDGLAPAWRNRRRVWSVHRQTPPYLSVRHSDVVNDLGSAYYWNAPELYLGNKISAYGGSLVYTVSYTTDQHEPMAIRVTSQPDLIIEIIDRRFGQPVYPSSQSTNHIPLSPANFLVAESAQPIGRRDFLSVLANVTRVMVRASYSTETSAVYRLHSFSMEVANPSAGGERRAAATCVPGFRRVNGNLYGGVCEACRCHGHSTQCHEVTGHCLDCSHHTYGPHCDTCLPGYYGNATRGSSADCQPCACPLNLPISAPPAISGERGSCCVTSASPGTQDHAVKDVPTDSSAGPLSPGDPVSPAIAMTTWTCPYPAAAIQSQASVCSVVKVTAARLATVALTVTTETRSQRKTANPVSHTNGSVSEVCNKETGRCECKQNVAGRQCDECIPNCWWDAELQDCVPCGCSPPGSMFSALRRRGRCICRPGFVGRHCDLRRQGYERRETRRPVERVPLAAVHQRWGGSSRTGGCPRGGVQAEHRGNTPGMPQTHGISTGGVCVPCHCNSFGSKSSTVMKPCSHVGNNCDTNTGQCICPPNTIGERCDHCAPTTGAMTSPPDARRAAAAWSAR